MKHYLHGGSTAKRLKQCPDWANQSAGVPKQESSHALRGTAIHWLLEQLNLDPAMSLLDHVNMPFDDLSFMIYDMEMIALAGDMWDADAVLCRGYQVDLYEAETTGEYSPLIGSTVDKVARGKLPGGEPCLLLIDYKTGMGVQVEAVGNDQLLHNAMCLRRNSTAQDLFVDVEHFVGAIIQPARDGTVLVKTWEFTRDTVDQFEAAYLKLVAVADSGAAPMAAGPDCNFCPANGLCDATTGQLLKMAQLDPKDVENLAWGLDHIEQVKKTIAAIEALAYDQLTLGVKIPGWKLVRGRPGNTRWINEDKAMARLRKLFGGKRNMVKEALLSPTQLLAVAKAQGIQDRATAIIDELTERPEPSKNTLAPESDKRPAVLSEAAFAAALAQR